MDIVTSRHIRKPLYVDAVQVTAENFIAIAKWCQGNIEKDDAPFEVSEGDAAIDTQAYIRVRVHNPKSPRQTKAFIGDWLLYTERGYKVYTHKAFKNSFDLVLVEPEKNGMVAVAPGPHAEPKVQPDGGEFYA